MIEESCQRLFNVKMTLNWNMESPSRVHHRRWGLEMREREMKKIEKLDSNTWTRWVRWQPGSHIHENLKTRDTLKRWCALPSMITSLQAGIQLSQKYFLKRICVQHVRHSSCPCSQSSVCIVLAAITYLEMAAVGYRKSLQIPPNFL